MTVTGDVVYLVILLSLTGPAVVSGQCTTAGCGALDDEDNNYFYWSEVRELKLQMQQMAAELGTLYCQNCRSGKNYKRQRQPPAHRVGTFDNETEGGANVIMPTNIREKCTLSKYAGEINQTRKSCTGRSPVRSIGLGAEL